MEDIKSIATFWKSMYDKSNEEKGQALVQRIENRMDFKRWGFRITRTDFPSYLRIVYDSEWCRVKFLYTRGRFKDPSLDEFSIDYGRLHAPDDQATMIWQDRKCNCWHNNRLVLFYLDGVTPQEVVQRENDGGWHNDIELEFRRSELGQILIENKLRSENWIQSEVFIWQHYGQRLFEVFDLRRPSLWDAYTNFVVEYHRLIGTPPPGERIAHIVAPQTEIC